MICSIKLTRFIRSTKKLFYKFITERYSFYETHKEVFLYSTFKILLSSILTLNSIRVKFKTVKISNSNIKKLDPKSFADCFVFRFTCRIFRWAVVSRLKNRHVANILRSHSPWCAHGLRLNWVNNLKIIFWLSRETLKVDIELMFSKNSWEQVR